MKAQIYFQFKQWFETNEGMKLGNTFYLGNMTFPCADDALTYLQNQIENQEINEDVVQNWELVRLVQDVVPNAIAK